MHIRRKFSLITESDHESINQTYFYCWRTTIWNDLTPIYAPLTSQYLFPDRRISFHYSTIS